MTPDPIAFNAQLAAAEAAMNEQPSATCKFCGTVGGQNCASLDEACSRTDAKPYGCSWLTIEDQIRLKASRLAPVSAELAAAYERIAELEYALRDTLGYIEFEEQRFGESLYSGDVARAALNNQVLA